MGLNNSEKQKRLVESSFKIFVLFIILTISVSFVNSATKETTPEASGFTKSGSGADPGFTGDIGIGVPLLTVPGRNGFDLPLSLDYSSGIRVDDEASWVGLGWNLGVGAITRAVVNVADDSADGMFNSNSKDFKDQDLYSLSFPGGGGRMFYGNDGVWRLRSWSPTKIIPNKPGISIDGWTVITPDGTIYKFNKKVMTSLPKIESRSIRYYKNAKTFDSSSNNINTDRSTPYASAWYITEILSNDYVDSDGISGPSQDDRGSWIKINYVDKQCNENGGYCAYSDPKVKNGILPLISSWALTGDYAWTYGYSFSGWAYTTGVPDPYMNYQFQRRDILKQRTYLQSIETPIARAEFQTDDSFRRDDLQINEYPNNVKPTNVPPALRNIVLYNTINGNYRINRIEFNYATHGSSQELAKGSEGDIAYGKLTLLTVKTYGEDDTISIPETKFEYGNNDPLNNPNYNRMAFDWWGFYNGKTTNNGYNFLHTDPDPLHPFVLEYFADPTKDDDHEANDNAKVWSLTKVTYPTGGSIIYDYEVDKYKYYVWKNPAGQATGNNIVFNVINAADSANDYGDLTDMCDSANRVSINQVNGGGIRLKSKTISDGVNSPYTFTYQYGDGVASQYLNFISSFMVNWNELGPFDDVYVGYRDVTVNTPNGLYGKSKTIYTSNYEYPNELNSQGQNGACWADRYLTNKEYLRGLVTESASYKADDNVNPIQKQITTYDFSHPDFLKGRFEDTEQKDSNDNNIGYKLDSVWGRATQSESILDNVKTKVTYDFYNLENGQVTQSTEYNSNGDRRISKLTFAQNDPASGIDAQTLINKNMITLPYTQTTDYERVISFPGGGGVGYIPKITESKVKYGILDGTRIYPIESSVWLNTESRYITTTTPITAYDDYGQALGSIDAKGNVNSDGYTVSLFYGDNGNPCESPYYLKVGDQVTVEPGKTLTLNNVASGTSPQSVIVNVDGITQTINPGSMVNVNGLYIKVISTSYFDDVNQRAASLYISGRVFKNAYLTCVKNALGQQVITNYYNDGTVYWIQDPNGISTWYSYDKLNRLTDIKPVNDAGIPITSVFYNYQYAADYCPNGIISDTCTNRVKTNTIIDLGADNALGGTGENADLNFVAAEFWDGLGRTHQNDLMEIPGVKHIRSYTTFNEIGAKLYESKPYEETDNVIAGAQTFGSLSITGKATSDLGIKKTSKTSGIAAILPKKTTKTSNNVYSLNEYTPSGQYSVLNDFNPLSQSSSAQAALKSKYVYYNEPLVRVKELYPIDGEPSKVSTTYSSTNGATEYDSYTGFDSYNGLFVNEVRDENVVYIVEYDANGNRFEYPAPGTKGISRTYTDLFGNVVKTISAADTVDAAETITKYDILNRPIKIKNAIGQETVNTYDSLGRVLMTTNPDFGTITYTYDDNGNILTKTHGGIVVSYNYDKLNRATKVTYSSLNEDKSNGIKVQSLNTVYLYDVNNPKYTSKSIGRLSMKFDDTGIHTYFYDHRGRLKKQQVYFRDYCKDICPTCKFGCPDVVATNGQPPGDGTAGLADFTALTPGLTDGYDYNNPNYNILSDFSGDGVLGLSDFVMATPALSAGTTGVARDWKITTYNYDNANNIKNITDPQGTVTEYFYDTLNRVVNVKANQNGVATYTYNTEQTVKDVTFGNNVITKYDYTTRDWLTSIKTTKADGTALFNRAYDFDNSGNIERYWKDYDPSTQTYSNLMATFTYDNQYRLETATSDDRNFYVNDITYDYDKIGNRLYEIYGVNNEYKYDTYTNKNNELLNNNRLIFDASNSYTYDERGNMKTKKSINILKNGDLSIDDGKNYFTYLDTNGAPIQFQDDSNAGNNIPDGWHAAGAITIDLLNKHDNNPSTKLTATTGVDGAGTIRARVSEDIPVEPGKTYLVEGWIMNNGLTLNAKGTILTQCVDKDHNALLSGSCGLKKDYVNGQPDPAKYITKDELGWKKISFTVTADNKDYPFIGVYCYVFADGANAGGGSINCDEFTVKEVVDKGGILYDTTSYLWDSDNRLMGICSVANVNDACNSANMIAEYYYDDGGIRGIKKVVGGKTTRYIGSPAIYEETD